MEKGTAGSSGGSVDRRRTTVSGPLPQLDIDEHDIEDGRVHSFDEAMKLPWSSQPTPSASIHPSKPAGRKRSVSGGIFSRLNFMKNAGDDGKLQPRDDQDQATPGVKIPKSPKNFKARKSIDDGNEPTTAPASPVEEENAMSAAMKPVKTRKRKGSLRKTALLGTRRIVTEGRERKNSLLQRSPSSKQPQPQPPAPQQYIPRPIPTQAPKGELSQTSFSDTNESNTSLRTKFSYENIRASYSSDSGWSRPAAPAIGRLSLLTEQTGQENDQDSVTELASSMDPLSANSQTSYTSTTDDDDVLTFDRPANSFVGAPRDGTALKKPLSSAATGYFPPVASASQESLTRRLSSKKSRSSPLSHNITTLSSFPESEPHDYTETEYWGWVILFITWLTFTVGMGSCLEIWSWAWDVGETPYAPPELENDDTLPIVGYYPAMIVLTGVVAWVWITVAWVGMKYFRHAKIEV